MSKEVLIGVFIDEKESIERGIASRNCLLHPVQALSYGAHT